MIIILHGDNTKESREAYFQLRQKYPTASVLEGEKATITDVTEAIEGNGLFSTVEAAFIEQLLTKRRTSAELDAIIDFLNQTHAAEIILWEGKEIDKKVLKKFPKSTAKLFSYPQALFQFLDAIQPKNTQQLIHLFHQTLQKTEVELVLFMLIKQFRLMLALKDDKGETISEVKFMQPWQKTKLVKQAKQFSLPILMNLYLKLYDCDIGYKTGRLSYPLAESLDFFLAEI